MRAVVDHQAKSICQQSLQHQLGGCRRGACRGLGDDVEEIVVIQPGPPATSSSLTPYAVAMRLSMVASRIVNRPSCKTPPKFCAAQRAVGLA